MIRYLLLVLTTLLLSGCCTGFFCESAEMEWIGRRIEETECQWKGSREAAGGLWDEERDRTDRTHMSATIPDTTEAATLPDTTKV